MFNMSTFYSPEDYVKAKVIQYPSLYASANFETSKFLVFDQLFNTIGNGVRSWRSFKKEISVRDVNLDRAEIFTRGEKIFYGYKGITTLAEVQMSGAFEVTVADCERINYPEITFWMESSFSNVTLADVNPYPCFDENYSLLYNMDCSKLSEDWIRDIIWFYEECQRFFADDKRWLKYAYAYPNEDSWHDEDLRSIIGKRIEEYTEAGTLDKLYMDYGVKYTGDLESFLVQRWNLKRENIEKFLKKTLIKLKGLL